MPKKPKSIIVLNSLLSGGSVFFKGEEYALSEDNDLVVKRYKYKTPTDQNPTEMWLSFDATLQCFINMCDKMTDDEIVIVAANTALRTIRQESKKGI